MHDFHYRLPARMGGQRPGSHPGTSLGSGQEFAGHASLLSRPDPRRLDVRASLRAGQLEGRGDWLVRVTRQRVGVPVYALADVSASMLFGARRTKLEVLADFVEAMGHSAFRVGDAAGMVAFDTVEREDCFLPATLSRGSGHLMSALLRGSALAGSAGKSVRENGLGDPLAGLAQAAQRLAGKQSLIFLVSDFHWPFERLAPVLEMLARAYVVPVVIWDAAELEPPGEDGLVSLRDAESGARRTLWLRPKFRAQWRDAVRARREAIHQFFTLRSLRPFWTTGAFNPEAMSEYFFEANA